MCQVFRLSVGAAQQKLMVIVLKEISNALVGESVVLRCAVGSTCKNIIVASRSLHARSRNTPIR